MDEARNMRTVWAAMWASHFIYMVVLLAVPRQDAPDPTLWGVLVALALMELPVAVLVLPRVLVKTPAQTAFLVRWAVIESAVVLVFVACFLGASLALYGGMLVLAAAAMFAARPTDDAWTAWEMRRLE